MASKTRSIKLPPALDEVCDIRYKVLGYPSKNAYIKALIQYDAMVQGAHTITLPLAHQSPAKQDEINEKCLEFCKRGGKGERGQFLQYFLDGVAKPKGE